MKKPKKRAKHRQQRKMKKEARRKKIRAAKRKNYLSLIDKIRGMDEDEFKEFAGEDYEPEPEVCHDETPGYEY